MVVIPFEVFQRALNQSQQRLTQDIKMQQREQNIDNLSRDLCPECSSPLLILPEGQHIAQLVLV